MQQERRYPREKMDRDIICYTKSNDAVGIERSYFFASLRDVSKEGAGLQTDQDCMPDDEVWLDSSVDVSAENIPGKVVWTKKTGDTNSLGLFFSIR